MRICGIACARYPRGSRAVSPSMRRCSPLRDAGEASHTGPDPSWTASWTRGTCAGPDHGQQRHLATAAHAGHGTGRPPPAGLRLGDRVASAGAQVDGVPLRGVGDGRPQTDIRPTSLSPVLTL
jgi:hypothetical protein